ncbi:hypothetical protein ACJRO7_011058 [Eucalyptus globulus]|uniref:Rhamnogalacturonase A/B/Epimerase-like pectate lyase domain-containing protein n=1 Tax=Eucalyptus globulus TaxID=34317 RepID=A0ABD3LEV8_EUCGL
MGKFSFKSLMAAFAVAIFVWCISCCEVCNAREVTDRRSHAAAAADDSTTRSSLWLWRGRWRIPHFPLPPFPFYRPWPYLPLPHWPYLPRPRPVDPHHDPHHQGPRHGPPKQKPPPTPMVNPTPTPSPPQAPIANPTPPTSLTPLASPTPLAMPTLPDSPTAPPSLTPPAVPTPPVEPTPPDSPAPTAVPTPLASPTLPVPTPLAPPTPSIPSNSTTFNVLDYGAKGDGNTDDTKAFQDAWAASCNVEASTMVVPANHVFLVGPISFLDGTVVAPTDPQVWGGEHWLHFDKLSRFTLQGSGTVDGRGSVWWRRSQSEDLNDDLLDVDNDADDGMDSEDADTQAKEELSLMPRNKPTAMRFDHCLNVTFSGIKIQNSPNFHLTFDHSVGVLVRDMSISSPGDSPNTDGIHLGNSQDVTIHDATLACGDDCISIVSGCSNIHIHDVHCGPGHGISIGSLGKDHSKACVHNITVEDVDLQGTTNGVRIKSWQGGSGSVYGVKFSNIRVSEVRWPIIIDQYYCDHATCTNQSSAVAVRDVTYEHVSGTYTERSVGLACSDSVPCEDITLSAIDLRPSSQKPPSHDDGPFCWQTFGQLTTPISPPIDCVQIGRRSSNGIGLGQDSC